MVHLPVGEQIKQDLPFTPGKYEIELTQFKHENTVFFEACVSILEKDGNGWVIANDLFKVGKTDFIAYQTGDIIIDRIHVMLNNIITTQDVIVDILDGDDYPDFYLFPVLDKDNNIIGATMRANQQDLLTIYFK